MKTKIQTTTESYVTHYPEAIDFAEKQESIFWTSREIAVEKDVQSLRVDMTPAESHGVITTLKLFTLYELVAGNEYWLGRVRKMFPRPEIERMASTFGFFELGVHAPFYNKINEALLLNTDEFYTDYVNDPTLVSRMDYIDKVLENEDDLYSLGVFSMIEGAVLYSSFAFLKHFQALGKNKLMNVVRGINFSVRDENLHSEAGAWLFHKLKGELGELGKMSQKRSQELTEGLYEAAEKLREHEYRIIDMIFEKGEIDGITPEQMKTFVKSRINLCLNRLGLKDLFEVHNNIVADWFYDNINMQQFGDFFTGVLSSYNRDWDQTNFTWE